MVPLVSPVTVVVVVVMSVVLTLGILGLFGVPLNPANMIAFPIILGIGADNGVHVFSATFGTAGSETVTATDAVDGFTASATTTVATLHFGFGNNPWGTYGNLFDNY